MCIDVCFSLLGTTNEISSSETSRTFFKHGILTITLLILLAYSVPNSTYKVPQEPVGTSVRIQNVLSSSTSGVPLQMLSEGLFLRSRLLLFLPKMVPRTLLTELTPSLRRMGIALRSWTDRASRRRLWKARETPAKLSAALTS